MLWLMAVGTVVMLPGRLDPERSQWIAALRGAGAEVLDLDLPMADPAPISARACVAIHEASPPGPLVIVAPPASAGIVAAVALAQRTAHRVIGGYVLIDPPEDPTGNDWPDAPVHVLAAQGSAAFARARLRGWTSGDPDPASLAAAVASLG